MDFSKALALVKAGKRLQRPHMHDEHTIEKHSTQMAPPDGLHPNGQWTEPKPKKIVLTSFVFSADKQLTLHTVDGRDVPWHASQEDLLADDWVQCTASPSTAS